MPEHREGPEAADLDAVFRDLVVDVDTRSRPYGAGRARRTADVRRFAVAAGALAVVVVLALGLGGLVHGRSVGVPVAGPPTPAVASPSSLPPSTDPNVPAPSLLTIERLNRASAGWVRWGEGTADVTDVPSCRTKARTGPDPVGSQIDHYRVGTTVDASLERMTYASRDDSNAAMRGLVEAFEACPEGVRLSNHDFSADLEVVAYTWGSGHRQGAVWLVNFGDRMDVLSVVGAPAPAYETRREVSWLLAADVQVP